MTPIFIPFSQLPNPPPPTPPLLTPSRPQPGYIYIFIFVNFVPLNQYSIYNFSPLSSTNHYPNRTMKKRDLSLDIIRILACCMVVFMHSPIPSTNAPGPFLTALSYITAPCIGLFFMVSGALLLPVKIDYFSFLKQRLSKIILPTLAWTAIYLTLKIYYSESEINVMQSILSIPFTAQGHGVLWFMYTLTGLYLIAPILSAWLEKASTNEIQFILMLWCITLPHNRKLPLH